MINIGCLGACRRSLHLNISYLNKIQNHDFYLTVMSDIQDMSYYENVSSKANFPVIVVPFVDGYNYMSKIQYLAQSNSDYVVKLDDDMCIHTHTWQHMFDNIGLLDDQSVLFMTPTMSNELPSCDMFIESFCDEDDKNQIYKLFLQQEIPSNGGSIAPGCTTGCYKILNQHTILAKKWNYKNWWNTVSNIEYPYKGIHPMRLSDKAQLFMMDNIIKNIDKFIQQKPESIHIEDWPYVTNGVFCIQTDRWRRVIYDNSLYVDGFDEVPLNKYKDINNLKVARSDGYCIHPAYSSVPNSRIIINQFYQTIESLLDI